MNKKSFFLGVLTGVLSTFVILFVIGLVKQKAEDNDPIQYLEKPVSYEDKTESSFKVFQVLGNAVLAREESPRIGDDVFDDVLYLGNTVMILGENYYNDQIIKIKNPLRIGTYSYITNGGNSMTVPVIDGDIN